MDEQQRTTQQQGYEPVEPLYGAPAHKPEPTEVDEGVDKRHQESAMRYPTLGLSRGEYVVAEVKRHPIGLLSIWIVVGLIVFATFALLPLYSTNLSTIADALMLSEQNLPSPAILGLVLMVASGLFVAGGLLATYVYNGNRFYLTNESVIQHIQISLFSKKEQHINLANIEDASYRQAGIVQHLFGYGSLRLSTEGDETTYRFPYVANPRNVVHQVTEAIENATGNAARFRQDGQPPIEIGKH